MRASMQAGFIIVENVYGETHHIPIDSLIIAANSDKTRQCVIYKGEQHCDMQTKSVVYVEKMKIFEGQRVDNHDKTMLWVQDVVHRLPKRQQDRTVMETKISDYLISLDTLDFYHLTREKDGIVKHHRKIFVEEANITSLHLLLTPPEVEE